MALLRPPGAIDDFERRPELRDAYAEVWDQWLRLEIKANGEDADLAFEPPILDAPPDPAEIGWDAFPKALRTWFADGPDDEARWRVAEIPKKVEVGVTAGGAAVQRFVRQQDEYCEWFVRRDDMKLIQRIDFTCEPPEYWEFLANGTDALFRQGRPPGVTEFKGDITLVHELYQEYVDPNVQLDDLRWPSDVRSRTGKLLHRKGEYDRLNRWNTLQGAMHLTHPANTLGAEINLAARGTVVRRVSGQDIVDVDDLVCCAGFGDANRSSDPHIGSNVNELARLGVAVALADPIGLYIRDVPRDPFLGPAGWDFAAAWDTDRQRGKGDRILRKVFVGSPDGSVPIEEIRVKGTAITRGSHIADAMQMVLVGEAHGPAQIRRQGCETKCCAHPTHPSFRAAFGKPCSQIPWHLLEPEEGGGSDEAVVGVAREVPLFEDLAKSRAL